MQTKQVIVIRKDLNMRKGKMIAQGAHASMKVILDEFHFETFNDTATIVKRTFRTNNPCYQWLSTAWQNKLNYIKLDLLSLKMQV